MIKWAIQTEAGDFSWINLFDRYVIQCQRQYLPIDGSAPPLPPDLSGYRVSLRSTGISGLIF